MKLMLVLKEVTSEEAEAEVVVANNRQRESRSKMKKE